MAKKTKAQAASAGTKADPKRADATLSTAASTQDGTAGGAERPSWYLPALDERNLSARERQTKRIFTTVQVVLCLVLVATGVSASAAAGGLTSEGLQAMFAKNPATAISLVASCLQPFVAYLVGFAYKHYVRGDAGYAAANLIALLCAEMMLQSMVGIVAIAILLWRVWRRGSQAMGDWTKARGIGGILVDISGPLVVIVFAGICLFASAQLS